MNGTCSHQISRNSDGWCNGFSLVEALIVVAIIATVAGIAVPNYIEAVHTAKIVRAMGDIKEISIQIDIHRIGNNSYPESLDDLGLGDMKDPWHNPYEYLKIEGTKNVGHCRKDKNLNPLNSDYDLFSVGRDGKSSSALTAKVSRDDVVRASNGGFIGVAENY